MMIILIPAFCREFHCENWRFFFSSVLRKNEFERKKLHEERIVSFLEKKRKEEKNKLRRKKKGKKKGRRKEKKRENAPKGIKENFL